MRNRSIKWCEKKVVSALSKGPITTELALSAVVLRNVRSIIEQHNLDSAIEYLIAQKQITEEKDKEGFTVYRLLIQNDNEVIEKG